MMCRPRSSLLWALSSWFRVDDFNPSLRPSLQYLLAVRSDSCSRTSSRSSLAIKDNIIHELIIFIMLVYQHVSLTQCLLGYLIYTSSILTSSWFFMCCSHEYNEDKINTSMHSFSLIQSIHLVHATMTEEVSNSVCSLVRGYSACSLHTHWHTTHQLPQPLWNTCLNSESEVGEEREENNKKGSPEKEIGLSCNWSTEAWPPSQHDMIGLTEQLSKAIAKKSDLYVHM